MLRLTVLTTYKYFVQHLDNADPMSQPTSPADQAELNAFLASHPEILIGRAALDKEEKNAGDDTFSIVNKPLSNVVLVQYFDADTLKRLFAVALVNDQKAEDYYKRASQDEDDKEEDPKSCPECGAGSSRSAIEGPSQFVYECMATCPKTCPNAQVGRMWPA